MTAAVVFEWIGGVLVLAGSLFMVVGAFGLIRMPDVFTRIHAASVSDTFGVSLILVGLIFYAGFTLVAVKLVFIVLFLLLTGPVATHAVARAALDAGCQPVDEAGKAVPIADGDNPPPPRKKKKEAKPSKR